MNARPVVVKWNDWLTRRFEQDLCCHASLATPQAASSEKRADLE